MNASRAAGPDVFPASFAQERMWFLGQFDQDRAVYNISALLPMEFAGPFDPDLLERALREVVRRHEPLRTSFALRDDRVVQVIARDLPIAVARTDLSSYAAPEGRDRLQRIAVDEAARPFALDRAPLWRARLVRLAADDWRLIWVVDHTVFDGRSADVFVAELYEHYRAISVGRAPQVPELRIQYADYTVWQQQRYDGGVLDTQLDYWRTTLAGLPADVGVVTDRSRPAIRTDAGDLHELDASAELTRSVDELAHALGVTPFMVLLTAFKALLARWSARTDIVVGCPVSGRIVPELEHLIGMFINVIVVRTDLSADPTFRDAVGRVRTSLLEGLEHQDVPFEKLVEALRPARDPSRPPLYQIAFNLVPADTTGQISNGTAKVDIGFDVNTRAGHLHGRIEYNSDLFERETMQRFATAYQTLLAGAVAAPDTPLSALPVVEAGDRALLETWSASGPAAPRPLLADAFTDRMHMAPDAIAIVDDAESLTYADLDARVERVTRHLRHRGVGPEVRVGVCADRSAALVVALLAVMRAGGAYVTLDPVYPEERLRFMTRDAGTTATLTTRTRRAVAGTLGVPALALEDLWELDPPPSAAPEPPPDDATAYVIYTSGSTGTPKGVEVPHRALATRVWWMRDRYGLTGRDRVLQFASPSFDTHAEEIYPCLIAGGTLVVVPARAHLPELFRTGRGASLTVVDLPTSYWEELVTGPAPVEWPASLRLVILGADELHPAALEQWYATAGERIALMHTYGPTESTIIATAGRLDPSERARRPTIGRPLAGTRVHVLDERLRPVPIGAPGELHIAGDGLARGYRNRPGLTAERFVPNPYGPPGSRMYATGDRARFRGDGGLEFLGRSDHQVKIRGHRVELGEVEAALRAHPRVAQAVVALRDDRVGDQRLVGYVVARAGEPPASGELRRHLARTLPEFMQPNDLVVLDDMPRTPAGKVDRGALPTPGGGETEGAGVEPSTACERMVATIWADALGVSRVGALDDFFDLGGHSLLATRVVARLSEAVGRAVPLRALFTAPTVRGLAAVVDGMEAPAGRV